MNDKEVKKKVLTNFVQRYTLFVKRKKETLRMNEEKWKIIRNFADEYKKLPKDKQMFILGFMQGVLSSEQKKPERQEVQKV